MAAADSRSAMAAAVILMQACSYCSMSHQGQGEPSFQTAKLQQDTFIIFKKLYFTYH